jgi:mannose-6-phosphate isomerase-like protein (cupin superfamily)
MNRRIVLQAPAMALIAVAAGMSESQRPPSNGGATVGQSPTASFAKPLDALPVRRSKGNAFRPVVTGTTADGEPLEVHETTLAPGAIPHPPHAHRHEEMFLIREGNVEVTIAGKSTQLGPGGVAFVHSLDRHGIRNVGSAPARYFVIALGRQ